MLELRTRPGVTTNEQVENLQLKIREMERQNGSLKEKVEFLHCMEYAGYPSNAQPTSVDCLWHYKIEINFFYQFLALSKIQCINDSIDVIIK